MKVLFFIIIVLIVIIALLIAYIFKIKKTKGNADGTLALEAAEDGRLAWKMNIVSDITSKDQIVLNLIFNNEQFEIGS